MLREIRFLCSQQERSDRSDTDLWHCSVLLQHPPGLLPGGAMRPEGPLVGHRGRLLGLEGAGHPGRPLRLWKVFRKKGGLRQPGGLSGSGEAHGAGSTLLLSDTRFQRPWPDVLFKTENRGLQPEGTDRYGYSPCQYDCSGSELLF